MTVGIAIALYNGERFLRQQLDCLRTQTQAPDRVVLCDDGSSDATLAIVQDYIAEFSLEEKWSLVINPQNLGYARNFYNAMYRCDTDLIFLCDQDDLWKPDKIEKMAQVMTARSDISLLSCKYEIIDADNQPLRGFLERHSAQTGQLQALTHTDLLRSFHWPGMVMCVRGDFFRSIYDRIKDATIPHDCVLAHCATETGGFYELDYIGACHRRHGNNTAKEEHRIRKLLNLQRKLMEMRDYTNLLQGLLNPAFPLGETTQTLIHERMVMSEKREAAIRSKNLKALLALYRNDPQHLLRTVSFVCDVWLILFGGKP